MNGQAFNTPTAAPVRAKDTASLQPIDSLKSFEQSLSSAHIAIIGDTVHSQPLMEFLGSDKMLDALQAAGKKYIGIEFMPYNQNAVDQLAEGHINREEFIEIFVAQADARHFTFLQSKRDIASEEADLILNARKRGISVILFDRQYGEERVEREYRNVIKLQEKHRSNSDNTLNIITARSEIDFRNRISPAVNRDMISTMIKAITSEEKRAHHHKIGFRYKPDRMPGFAIFIGYAHCYQIADALNRKGLKSVTSYIFADEFSVDTFRDHEQESNRRAGLIKIVPDQENYLVRDGLRWHAAGLKSLLNIPSRNEGNLAVRP